MCCMKALPAPGCAELSYEDMLVLTCAWPCRVCQPQEALMENIQQQQSLGLSKAGWQEEGSSKSEA